MKSAKIGEVDILEAQKEIEAGSAKTNRAQRYKKCGGQPNWMGGGESVGEVRPVDLVARKPSTAAVMPIRIQGASRLRSVGAGFDSTIEGWHELRPQTHQEIARARSAYWGNEGKKLGKRNRPLAERQMVSLFGEKS